MKCPICRNGSTSDGVATVTLERSGTTVVFRNVPARICSTCGEVYVGEDISTGLLRDAEAAVAKGVQVEVRAFAA